MGVNEPEKAREAAVVDVDTTDDGGQKDTPATKTTLDVVDATTNAKDDATNVTTNTPQVSANNLDGINGKGTLDPLQDIVEDEKAKDVSLGPTEESPLVNAKGDRSEAIVPVAGSSETKETAPHEGSQTEPTASGVTEDTHPAVKAYAKGEDDAETSKTTESPTVSFNSASSTDEAPKLESTSLPLAGNETVKPNSVQKTFEKVEDSNKDASDNADESTTAVVSDAITPTQVQSVHSDAAADATQPVTTVSNDASISEANNSPDAQEAQVPAINDSESSPKTVITDKPSEPGLVKETSPDSEIDVAKEDVAEQGNVFALSGEKDSGAEVAKTANSSEGKVVDAAAVEKGVHNDDVGDHAGTNGDLSNVEEKRRTEATAVDEDGAITSADVEQDEPSESKTSVNKPHADVTSAGPTSSVDVPLAVASKVEPVSQVESSSFAATVETTSTPRVDEDAHAESLPSVRVEPAAKHPKEDQQAPPETDAHDPKGQDGDEPQIESEIHRADAETDAGQGVFSIETGDVEQSKPPSNGVVNEGEDSHTVAEPPAAQTPFQPDTDAHPTVSGDETEPDVIPNDGEHEPEASSKVQPVSTNGVAKPEDETGGSDESPKADSPSSAVQLQATSQVLEEADPKSTVDAPVEMVPETKDTSEDAVGTVAPRDIHAQPEERSAESSSDAVADADDAERIEALDVPAHADDTAPSAPTTKASEPSEPGLNLSEVVTPAEGQGPSQEDANEELLKKDTETAVSDLQSAPQGLEQKEAEADVGAAVESASITSDVGEVAATATKGVDEQFDERSAEPQTQAATATDVVERTEDHDVPVHVEGIVLVNEHSMPEPTSPKPASPAQTRSYEDEDEASKEDLAVAVTNLQGESHELGKEEAKAIVDAVVTSETLTEANDLPPLDSEKDVPLVENEEHGAEAGVNEDEKTLENTAGDGSAQTSDEQHGGEDTSSATAVLAEETNEDVQKEDQSATPGEIEISPAVGEVGHVERTDGEKKEATVAHSPVAFEPPTSDEQQDAGKVLQDSSEHVDPSALSGDSATDEHSTDFPVSHAKAVENLFEAAPADIGTVEKEESSEVPTSAAPDADNNTDATDATLGGEQQKADRDTNGDAGGLENAAVDIPTSAPDSVKTVEKHAEEPNTEGFKAVVVDTPAPDAPRAEVAERSPSPSPTQPAQPERDHFKPMLEDATTATEHSEDTTFGSISHLDASDAHTDAGSVTTVTTAKPSVHLNGTSTTIDNESKTEQESDNATEVPEQRETPVHADTSQTDLFMETIVADATSAAGGSPVVTVEGTPRIRTPVDINVEADVEPLQDGKQYEQQIPVAAKDQDSGDKAFKAEQPKASLQVDPVQSSHDSEGSSAHSGEGDAKSPSHANQLSVGEFIPSVSLDQNTASISLVENAAQTPVEVGGQSEDVPRVEAEVEDAASASIPANDRLEDHSNETATSFQPSLAPEAEERIAEESEEAATSTTQQSTSVLPTESTNDIEEEESPLTSAYLRGPSAHSANDMHGFAEAASAQDEDNEDTVESAHEDGTEQRALPRGADVDLLDVSARAKGVYGDLEANEAEDGEAVEGQSFGRAQTPTVLITAPEPSRLDTESDTYNETRQDASPTIASAESAEPGDSHESVAKLTTLSEGEEGAASVYYHEGAVEPLEPLVEHRSSSPTSDGVEKAAVPGDQDESKEDAIEPVSAREGTELTTATQDEVAQAVSPTGSAIRVIDTSANPEEESVPVLDGHTHQAVPNAGDDIPEIVTRRTGSVTEDLESSAYGEIATELSADTNRDQTDSVVALSAQSIPGIEIAPSDDHGFKTAAVVDISESGSADDRDTAALVSTSRSLYVDTDLQDAQHARSQDGTRAEATQQDTSSHDVVVVEDEVQANLGSHEGGEDVPRDNRLSKSTDSTAQVANNEPPPPPYQEVALTVDEAVAKAVSTADSKESKDAGSSETRDVPDVAQTSEPDHQASPSPPWAASYSVTTQGPGMLEQDVANDREDVAGTVDIPRSPVSISKELVDDDNVDLHPADQVAEDKGTPFEADKDIGTPAVAEEEIPRPRSPYPLSYTVTKQGAGSDSGKESSPGKIASDAPPVVVAEAHSPLPVVDALQLTPTKKRYLEGAIEPAPVLDLLEEQEDAGSVAEGPEKRNVLSEQALVYLNNKVSESRDEVAPEDSVSDVSVSDVPEPAMTPKSDLGIFTPGFDTRSEVSRASRDTIPPDSPRLDPEAPLGLEEPTSMDLDRANRTPTREIPKPSTTVETALPENIEQFSLPTPLVKQAVVPDEESFTIVPHPKEPEPQTVEIAAHSREDPAQEIPIDHASGESVPDRTIAHSPITRPADVSKSVVIEVQSPSESEASAPLTYVSDVSTHGEEESEPASSSFDADIDSDNQTSSAFSMVGSEFAGDDQVEDEHGAPSKSARSEPQPEFTRRDTEFSAELVDLPPQSLSDSGGVLVYSHTVPATDKTLTAVAPAESVYAEASEAAADEDQFSLASGMSESVAHLSELDSISDRSTQAGNFDNLPDISTAVSQASLPQYDDEYHLLSVGPDSVIHMSPTVPSEMALTMPAPDGAEALPVDAQGESAPSDFVAVDDNGHEIPTGGTATPRQLRKAASFSPRSAGTPPSDTDVPKISEPAPEAYAFPSLVVSRETSQSTVETTSSGPSTTLTSVPEYGDFEPISPPMARKRLESTLSTASTRFPGAWVTNYPMIPKRPMVDIVAQGEFSRPSLDGTTPVSPLQSPGEESDDEKKSRCVIM